MSTMETYKAALQSKKIPELKALCKEKGIKNYSKLKKDDLISTLADHDDKNTAGTDVSAAIGTTTTQSIGTTESTVVASEETISSAQAGPSSATTAAKVPKAPKAAKAKASPKVKATAKDSVGNTNADDELAHDEAGPSAALTASRGNAEASSSPTSTQLKQVEEVVARIDTLAPAHGSLTAFGGAALSGTDAQMGQGKSRDSGMGVGGHPASLDGLSTLPNNTGAPGTSHGASATNAQAGQYIAILQSSSAIAQGDGNDAMAEPMQGIESSSPPVAVTQPAGTASSMSTEGEVESNAKGKSLMAAHSEIQSAIRFGLDASLPQEEAKVKGKPKGVPKVSKNVASITSVNAAASGSYLVATPVPAKQAGKKRKLTTKASVDPAEKDGVEQAELDGMLLALLTGTTEQAVVAEGEGMLAPIAKKMKKTPAKARTKKSKANDATTENADPAGNEAALGTSSTVAAEPLVASASMETQGEGDSTSSATPSKNTKLPAQRKKTIAKIAGKGPAGIALPGPSITTAAKAGSGGIAKLKSFVGSSIDAVRLGEVGEFQSSESAIAGLPSDVPEHQDGQTTDQFIVLRASSSDPAPLSSPSRAAQSTSTPSSQRATAKASFSGAKPAGTIFKGLTPLAPAVAIGSSHTLDHPGTQLSSAISNGMSQAISSIKAAGTASIGYVAAETFEASGIMDAAESSPATMYSGQVGGPGAKRVERSSATGRPPVAGTHAGAATTPMDRAISAPAFSFKALELVPNTVQSRSQDASTSNPSRSGCMEPSLEFADFGMNSQLARQCYDKTISASWLERNFYQVSKIKEPADAEGTPSPMRFFNAISRELYTNPDHPEQFTVALRFIIARIHTKLQNGEIEAFGSHDTVTGISRVCDGIWRVTSSSGNIQLICGATGDLLVARSDVDDQEKQGECPQWPDTRLDVLPAFALRHDWAAFVAAAISDHNIKLSSYIKSKDDDGTYVGGIARAFRSRLGPGRPEMIVAERFILSNLDPSSISGKWKSISAILSESAPDLTRAQEPHLVLYLDELHQIESVAFDIRQGEATIALHPAVALVSTCGKGTLFCLRSTGQVIGNQDADGINERWQNILGCDYRGIGLTPTATSQRSAHLWSQLGNQMDEMQDALVTTASQERATRGIVQA